jgi:hypothetical protein
VAKRRHAMTCRNDGRINSFERSRVSVCGQNSGGQSWNSLNIHVGVVEVSCRNCGVAIWPTRQPRLIGISPATSLSDLTLNGHRSRFTRTFRHGTPADDRDSSKTEQLNRSVPSAQQSHR